MSLNCLALSRHSSHVITLNVDCYVGLSIVSMQVLVGTEAKVLGLVLGLAQGLALGPEVVLGLELATRRALSMTRVVGRLMTGVPCRRSRTSSPLEVMLASTPSSKLRTACSSF